MLNRRDMLYALPAALAVGSLALRLRADGKVTVTLHLDHRLVEELRIAQESRNNVSLEEYITETLSCAVSDRSCLPKP